MPFYARKCINGWKSESQCSLHVYCKYGYTCIVIVPYKGVALPR